MKNFIVLLSALALLMTPSLSLATTQAAKTSTARGYTHTMCDTEGVDGVCAHDVNGDGNDDGDVFAIVDAYEEMTFFFTETGTTGTCDIYAASQAEDVPGTADLSTLNMAQINSTSLAAATDKITISGTFYYVWIQCDAEVAETVTVKMQGATGLKR